MIFTVKEERERYVKRILDLGTNLTEKEIGLLLDEKDVINQVGEYGEAWRIEEGDGKCKLIKFKWNYEEDCTPTDWELDLELEF